MDTGKPGLHEVPFSRLLPRGSRTHNRFSYPAGPCIEHLTALIAPGVSQPSHSARHVRSLELNRVDCFRPSGREARCEHCQSEEVCGLHRARIAATKERQCTGRTRHAPADSPCLSGKTRIGKLLLAWGTCRTIMDGRAEIRGVAAQEKRPLYDIYVKGSPEKGELGDCESFLH